MIATIAAVTFPFLIYWLSVSVIDETPSLFPLSPGFCFLPELRVLAMSHLIPLFPNIRGGPTVWSPDHGCAQSWPGLNGHSLIDDIKKDVCIVVISEPCLSGSPRYKRKFEFKMFSIFTLL